jgi:farnesyl-diphosphate farnesyltransferase
MDRCYELLDATARTFAISIRLIDDRATRDRICLMYLVLRALDTIEDEESVGPKEDRIRLLAGFYERLTSADATRVSIPCEPCKYRDLMTDIGPIVITQLLAQPSEVRRIVMQTCGAMAIDMHHFLLHPVDSWDAYDEYCNSVAGRLAPPIMAILRPDSTEPCHPSFIAMGNVLQRCNIIRDIRKDLLHGRVYWPPQAYAPLQRASQLLEPEHLPAAMLASRRMILELLRYMSHEFASNTVFSNDSCSGYFLSNFALGLATLVIVFGNESVFSGDHARRTRLDKAAMMHCFRTATNEELLADVCSSTGELERKALASGDEEVGREAASARRAFERFTLT